VLLLFHLGGKRGQHVAYAEQRIWLVTWDANILDTQREGKMEKYGRDWVGSRGIGGLWPAFRAGDSGKRPLSINWWQRRLFFPIPQNLIISTEDSHTRIRHIPPASLAIMGESVRPNFRPISPQIDREREGGIKSILRRECQYALLKNPFLQSPAHPWLSRIGSTKYIFKIRRYMDVFRSF
jgi:hypothetical protein